MQEDNNNKIKPWKCPRCSKTVTDYPALSRTDNKTEICSQCGTDEAMTNWLEYMKEKQ